MAERRSGANPSPEGTWRPAAISHFFFEQHDGRLWRIGGVAAIWAVLFGSKFVILEVVDFVFGDDVELGKLLEVILIALVMLVAKAVVVKVFDALGDRPTDATV